MKVRIVSARYMFEEDSLLEQYGEALNKVAPICYFCDIESGNVNIEMEVDSLDSLCKLSLEIQLDLALSRPIYEGRPFELWIKDDYIE
jgi:hypothetical protein